MRQRSILKAIVMDIFCAMLAVVLLVSTPLAWSDATNDFGDLMAAGDAARDRKAYSEAISHYRAALRLSPNSYEAKFQLARVLSFHDQRQEAIQLYSELLSTRTANTDLLLARGRTYAWEGQWTESEKDLITVTRLSPDYVDAWSALGDMYYWSDRYEAALTAYNRWIALAPTDYRGYLARARIHRLQNDYSSAHADLELARIHGASATLIEGLISSWRRRATTEATRPDRFNWTGSLGYQFSRFTPTRDRWNEFNFTVRRHWDRLSLAGEVLRGHRFGSSDTAVALDTYFDLWPRAYANARVQHSSDAGFYPELAYRLEVFQGAGTGWELSGSYDRLEFTSTNVNMYGVGVGKYTGNWYLRWRTLYIPSTPKSGLSHRMLARYYYSGDADDYIEFNGGFSRGGELRPQSQILEVTHSWTIGFAIQNYFSPRWGVKFTADYSKEDTTNPFVERSASLSLLFRW